MSRELPTEVRDALEQLKQIIDHLNTEQKQIFMDEFVDTAFIYIASVQDTAQIPDDQIILFLMSKYQWAKSVVKKINEALKKQGDSTNAH